MLNPKSIAEALDHAGAGMHEGLLTHFLGRRYAVVALLLLVSLMPLASVMNLFWVGVFLLYVAVTDAQGVWVMVVFALGLASMVGGLLAIPYELAKVAAIKTRGQDSQ